MDGGGTILPNEPRPIRAACAKHLQIRILYKLTEQKLFSTPKDCGLSDACSVSANYLTSLSLYRMHTLARSVHFSRMLALYLCISQRGVTR